MMRAGRTAHAEQRFNGRDGARRASTTAAQRRSTRALHDVRTQDRAECSDLAAAPATSTRTKGVAALLCILGFLSVAGVHRFYVGKIGTGILMLVTLGAVGVWTLIDLIINPRG